MGRAYKLYGTNTTSTNAISSLRVTKNANIRCICFSCAGVAGAGLTGVITQELAKQNVSSITLNDTPETVLGTISFPAAVNAGAFGFAVGLICNIPVTVGDTLYLNIVASGFTITSAIHEVTIYTD